MFPPPPKKGGWDEERGEGTTIKVNSLLIV